jgi:hypothetical protein
MIKRLVTVASLAVAALALAAAPAGADAPPGQGLTIEEGVFTCNGEEVTIVHPAGATGWIDGQHVVILSFTFSGPEGTFTKSSGKKTGLTPTYTCVGQEGDVTLTIVAAPVPPAR